MNLFGEAIKNEQRRNQRLIDLSEASEEMENNGCLAIERRGNRMYCYQQWYKGRKRVKKTYLGTPESEAVRRHLQGRMKQEELLRLHHNQEVLASLEGRYMDCSPDALLNALPASYRTVAEQNMRGVQQRQDLRSDKQKQDLRGVQQRQDLRRHQSRDLQREQRLQDGQKSHVWRLSDALFYDERYEKVRQWASADYKRNSAPFSKAATYAKDGTHVRSKGECLLYNLLQEHGLLFVYDCYMTFTNENGESRQYCPDFVIRCLDGTLIIIEHLGRLHDLEYSIGIGQKLHWYTMCGFVLGKTLFVTGDDANGGTDSNAIQDVIRRVERMFYGY